MMAVAIALASTMAQAAIIQTVGGGTSGSWTDSAIWTGGIVPGTVPDGADLTRIKLNDITLDTTVAEPLSALQIGRNAPGSLTVNSGAYVDLGGAGSVMVGEALNGSGTFIMNGGTITNLKTFTVANGANGANPASSAVIHGGTLAVNTADGTIAVGKAANASMMMDGGYVTTKSLDLGDSGNLFNGSFTLAGGTMQIGSIVASLTINTASTLTMEGTGQLIWGGNKVDEIAAFVTANDIVWASGSGSYTGGDIITSSSWTNGLSSVLNAAYDGTNTTVWVTTIPEPATVGMIGLGALITLLIRRMRG